MSKYKMGDELSLDDIMESGKDFSTFELKGYKIEGNTAIHPETQEAILLQDILDKIRNVRNEQEKIIAKRKNPSDPLSAVLAINKKR
ncbi:hypothetical protein [Priestia endophytica]|uniref:hypothetical protein n=1 Tax=Priestia endophytica TaxID=135735 RepID=UPI002280A311|nr:hypothetical protein [Priestia endophytica]MCY8231703.1 hypothetical protein [Priestia endophytica]